MYSLLNTITMTTTNRLISLFAAMLFATTMLADVVYEPLVVDSGFNRDCIAERYPINSSAAITYLNFDNSVTYCFATKSVIDSVNTHNGLFANKPTDFATAKESGWPDDYRDTIKCILDAKDNDLYKNVFWLLAPYDQPNVLTLRPNDEKRSTCQSTGTLKFKKIGCYSKLFFLTVSAREGTVSEARRVTAVIHYTDGSTSEAEFSLATGLGGEDTHKVCMTNTYEGYFNKNTGTQGKACASVFDMDVNPTKLIHRIEFSNVVKHSAAIILAVTGVTADVETPEEESLEVSDIEKTSFQACWDVIEDAASYRIDVAEDIDFQRILEDYNNLPVSGSTCQDIVNLVSNTDYYWRVRSVDADGGQSASSAVRRVKTAPDAEKGDTPPYAKEGNRDVEDMLAPYVNAKASLAELDIYRSLYRDGAFNTLCLPFDLDAAQIAASPLVGVQVYEYVSANTEGGQLNIVISEDPIDHITAGVPYLVKWDMNETEPIDKGKLVFKNVNVVTNQGQTLGGENEVKFVGNIGIATMVDTTLLGLDHNKLFLGAENKLYWPEATTSLKGFRAYFLVPDSPSGAPKRTPARIVQRENNATGIESVHHSAISIQKILRNGQICILRDGQTYNLLGGKMAPKP
jgi:hypothetical protein